MSSHKKIYIKVKPYSKKEGVSVDPSGVLVIRINAVPEGGKANERAIELLAIHLNVPKSMLEIVQGHSSRLKTILIKC